MPPTDDGAVATIVAVALTVALTVVDSAADALHNISTLGSWSILWINVSFDELCDESAGDIAELEYGSCADDVIECIDDGWPFFEGLTVVVVVVEDATRGEKNNKSNKVW